ncbi:MAG: 4-hydroxy-3-methylbut-2-enyl diphosphate reductase [Clostridia bacterium]|nr:4-hydroxy-3-methylbut-2-enyl diphosphate reductase [Clostridia bacterium]
MAEREITVAKEAGFCFGVKRATELLESAVRENGNCSIYTIGKLIHNPGYIRSLEERGVFSITPEELPAVSAAHGKENPVKVFVRAHGMTKETEELLLKLAEENPGFGYVDCTCPFVKKIHDIASSAPCGPNDIFILLGQSVHPEVVGIVSRYRGRSFVFSSAGEMESAAESGILPSGPEIFATIAAQTTQNLAEWKKSLFFLKKLYTKCKIFDTICSVTERRQLEAASIAEKSDFVIVIGGQDSSNTSKLFSVCRDKCRNTVCVEDASGLAGKIPTNCRKVGIVAGASTPGDKIEEVYKTMSEENKVEISFEELLDSACKTLNTGDTVTGIVIAVNDQEIKLDLGAKVTGILTAEQTTDDASVKLSSEFKVGDEIDVFVISVSDVDGCARVSKKRADLDKNWHKVTDAKESGETLEGLVTEAVKGGVVIKIYGARVFVPASQTALPKDADLSVLVGQTVKFKVIELKNGGGKGAVGSIRAAVSEERKALEKAFWSEIEVGKYYDGTVRGLTEYGAFIDLGGVDGMLHKKEMSWKPIRKPADMLKIGDSISVFVKSYDPEKRQISLGYRTEESRPWNKLKAQFAEGDVIDVTISSIMSYGAFAHVTDEIDGLIHISQIATSRVENVADVLSVGQNVTVKITKIDDEQQRVSLSIKAVLEEDADNDNSDEN